MDTNTSPLSSDHSIPSPAAEYKSMDTKSANKAVRADAGVPSGTVSGFGEGGRSPDRK